jgi:hypothetical protein
VAALERSHPAVCLPSVLAALHLTCDTGALVQVVQLSGHRQMKTWRTLIAGHREAIITT